MRNISSIGMVLALLCTISTPAFALGSTQTVAVTDGFLDQEKPDWIKAAPIPPELYPTLAETIQAANLIKHEASLLHISSPTYEQAHRLLLQNLLMMQRQLNFNDEALARFQSTSHPARSTVDLRIYRPNPTGIAMPPVIRISPLSSETRLQNAILDRTYSYRPSRRSIIARSEARSLARVNAR